MEEARRQTRVNINLWRARSGVIITRGVDVEVEELRGVVEDRVVADASKLDDSGKRVSEGLGEGGGKGGVIRA